MSFLEILCSIRVDIFIKVVLFGFYRLRAWFVLDICFFSDVIVSLVVGDVC